MNLIQNSIASAAPMCPRTLPVTPFSLRKILAAIAGVWLCVASPCAAQTSSDALTKRLEEITQSSGFPGFAVVVTQGDATLYSRGFGYADRASKTPYTPQTIQPLGSVSKSVVGVAVMKAVELGLCSLDADINEYLPFKVQNPYRPKDRITLRHLATHTSGLIDLEETLIGTYGLSTKPTVALGQFLRDYYSPEGTLYRKENFADTAVGKTYVYSNIAAALAAFIVEQRAKTPFDEFTEKHVFSPLGMSSTHWFFDEANRKKYATLYEINKHEQPPYKQLLNADNSLKNYSSVTYPDGSLRSSAADLTAYVKAMSNGYSGRAGILSVESFAMLFKPQFVDGALPANVNPTEPNSAIFWAYAKNGGIRHTGSDPGVFAFISFHPKTRIGRVFTLNTQLDGDDNEAVVKSFLSIIAALDRFEESAR